jgi:hypothetical protein
MPFDPVVYRFVCSYGKQPHNEEDKGREKQGTPVFSLCGHEKSIGMM